MWFRFNESIVDFSKVLRIFKKTDLVIVIEFEKGSTTYEYLSKENADVVYEKIWNLVSTK